MGTSIRARTTALTHPGLVRTANEDSYFVREDAGAWTVADGMGGHEHGQLASSMVVGGLDSINFTHSFDDDVDKLTGALLSANSEIFDTSVRNGGRMGSTVVALYICDDRFACIWAGDSRVYLFRDGALHRLSRDHTQVQEMVDRGMLTLAEAAHHPMSHVLSRAVGVQEALELEAISDTVRPRDIFLLCSDGLTGVVSESEIAERLSSLPADTACRHLLDLVLARGAPDNVTMIAVVCEEKTALTFAPLSSPVDGDE